MCCRKLIVCLCDADAAQCGMFTPCIEKGHHDTYPYKCVNQLEAVKHSVGTLHIYTSLFFTLRIIMFVIKLLGQSERQQAWDYSTTSGDYANGLHMFLRFRFRSQHVALHFFSVRVSGGELEDNSLF